MNVVASYMRDHAGNYMREISNPALKLLGLYGLQVSASELKSMSHSGIISPWPYKVHIDITNRACSAGSSNQRLYHPAVQGWRKSGS